MSYEYSKLGVKNSTELKAALNQIWKPCYPLFDDLYKYCSQFYKLLSDELKPEFYNLHYGSMLKVFGKDGGILASWNKNVTDLDERVNTFGKYKYISDIVNDFEDGFNRNYIIKFQTNDIKNFNFKFENPDIELLRINNNILLTLNTLESVLSKIGFDEKDKSFYHMIITNMKTWIKETKLKTLAELGYFHKM